MKITLIAAIGENNEIGKNNRLLWDLPADMHHFRSRTAGKTIIMGRKTFKSIGRLLPNRENIILSRDKNFSVEGAKISDSLESVLKELQKNKTTEVMIIGGTSIYTLALPFATHMSITHVEKKFPEADSFFPKFSSQDFEKISEKFLPKDTENKFSCRVREYERKK